MDYRLIGTEFYQVSTTMEPWQPYIEVLWVPELRVKKASLCIIHVQAITTQLHLVSWSPLRPRELTCISPYLFLSRSAIQIKMCHNVTVYCFICGGAIYAAKSPCSEPYTKECAKNGTYKRTTKSSAFCSTCEKNQNSQPSGSSEGMQAASK